MLHIFTFLIATEGRSPNLSCALGWESQGDQGNEMVVGLWLKKDAEY